MPAPPPKRLRVEESVVDGFGDDFTQEDLDQIDVITSQANHSPGHPGHITSQANHSPGHPGHITSQANHSPGHPGHITSQANHSPGHPGDHLSLLADQHSDLREKLKEVEEEVVLKEGEIRLLRDSLKGVQQEKEVQKEQHLLLEQQRHKEQQEKEKELLKKIQSLQADLHFKEAEINDTRSRLMKNSPSPRVLGSSPQVHHGRSSPSPTGNTFITKETFGAQLRPQTTPGVPNGTTLPRDSTAPVRPHGLLSLLLQPYLSPSSLSLCHLLMGRPHRPEQQVLEENPDFSLIQNLAMTGLNMLTPQPGPPRTRPSTRRCSGAVQLLPLLHHHLTELCDSLGSRGAGGGAEEARRGREERGLATLRVLQLLLAHSDQVVESLLQPETRVVTEQTRPGVGPGVVGLVLQLCDPGFCSPAEKKALLVHMALRSTSILLERSPHTHTHRLQGVCWLQAVSVCVSAGGSLQVVQECVCLLRCLIDHQLLTSTHESCVFLRLFQYIRTRPEPLTLDWTLLDLQVIRLLSRLLTQTDSTWSSNTHSCPCYTQVVQTVVELLHRHWLELRDKQTALPVPVGGVLREALLLLHWLLAHHGGFSEGCRAVLHLYHQVVPALRDALMTSSTPLTYSEELALEEVCRSEADDADDMDTEAGS